MLFLVLLRPLQSWISSFCSYIEIRGLNLSFLYIELLLRIHWHLQGLSFWFGYLARILLKWTPILLLNSWRALVAVKRSRRLSDMPIILAETTIALRFERSSASFFKNAWVWLILHWSSLLMMPCKSTVWPRREWLTIGTLINVAIAPQWSFRYCTFASLSASAARSILL